jgi:hypothetical protein
MKTRQHPIVLFLDDKDLGSVMQNATVQGGVSCKLHGLPEYTFRWILSQPVCVEYIAIDTKVDGTAGAKECGHENSISHPARVEAPPRVETSSAPRDLHPARHAHY